MEYNSFIPISAIYERGKNPIYFPSSVSDKKSHDRCDLYLSQKGKVKKSQK